MLEKIGVIRFTINVCVTRKFGRVETIRYWTYQTDLFIQTKLKWKTWNKEDRHFLLECEDKDYYAHMWYECAFISESGTNF